MTKKIIFILILSFNTTFAQSLNMKEIKSLSRDKAQNVFKEYREFLSLPNDANKPDELEANMIWCEKAFKKRGFKTERLKTNRLPLILAGRKHSGAKHTVLFYIQVDGQPVDPSKWSQSGPFVPTLKKQIQKDKWEAIPWESLYGNYNDDWRIFARSASDAKGPINTFLIALDIIAEKAILPNYNIKVIMDMEEEMGSPNLPPAVKKYKNKYLTITGKRLVKVKNLMEILSKNLNIPKRKINYLNNKDDGHYDIKPTPFRPRPGNALKVKKEKDFKESLIKLTKELKRNSS